MDLTQSGEGAILEKMIDSEFPKYFVDVGAYDGVSLSNSNSFMNKGWNGLLIEPNPYIFEKLVNNTQLFEKIRALNFACLDKEGEGQLFIGSDGAVGMLSTLCADKNSWFDFARSERKLQVQTRILTNVLGENLFPKDFGLLLIDAEGMDLEVLQGLNFNIYQPRIIVTEEYQHNVKKHKSKYKLLKENGYSLKHKLRTNTIWGRNEIYGNSSVDKDIFNFRKNIKKILADVNSLPLNFNKIYEVLSKNFKVELIKEPKWADDALLMRIQPLEESLTYDFTVKLHEDKYPLANHIYNSKDLLRKISVSGFAANIIDTDIIKNENYDLRYVLYDYIRGESLGKTLMNSDEEQINGMKGGLKQCVENLLLLGVNVFVRDLDDFIVHKNGDKYRVLLSDYNAIMDCSKSDAYSRKNIKGIIDTVIDKLATKNYRPFNSLRPTLIDYDNFRI